MVTVAGFLASLAQDSLLWRLMIQSATLSAGLQSPPVVGDTARGTWRKGNTMAAMIVRRCYMRPKPNQRTYLPCLT